MAGRRTGPRIYLRGKTYHCWFHDHHGKQVRKSTHQTDRALAKQAAQRIEREYLEQLDTPPIVALENALAQYLAKCDRADRSEETLEYYLGKSKPLLRVLGPDRDINALRLFDIEGYIDQRMEEIRERKPDSDRAIATVGKELGLLRSVLLYMRKQRDRQGQRLYREDPEELFPEGVIGNYVPRDRALSHAEYLAAYATLAPERRDYFQAFCGLGVRDSELYRMTPGDLDLLERRVHVRGTKTRGSKRWLHPNDELWDMLVRRAAQTADDQPLFPKWRNVRRALRGACTRANIEPVSPNDLRRTFATWQAEAGVPETVTSQLLGHTSSAMVRRVYARIGTDAKRAAMAKLPPLVPPTDCDVVCDKPEPKKASPGTPGTRKRRRQNDKTRAKARVPAVPRDGIEPPTRGFSILPGGLREAA